MTRGRYAPSPTGELHLGNASTALLAWLSVRSASGRFIMRMEDIDQNRVREGLAQQILDDLKWLGLDWDEGPDCGGPHPPYTQQQRGACYEVAFERLRADGQLYPCFCSRRDIVAAASAPQSPGDELRYPGTCRDLNSRDTAPRVAAGERHAWRYRVTQQVAPGFDDLVHGRQDGSPSPGDFVVYRADGVPAYQLAVVVDDAEMRVDEVVRGDDLLDSTARQLLLYQALGHAAPRFGHVPLWLGSDGVRLSKRHRGVTLRELREDSVPASRIVGCMAHRLGLRNEDTPIEAADLVHDFSWDRLATSPGGIRIATAGFMEPSG